LVPWRFSDAGNEQSQQTNSLFDRLVGATAATSASPPPSNPATRIAVDVDDFPRGNLRMKQS
jgi:hypothetical protein